MQSGKERFRYEQKSRELREKEYHTARAFVALDDLGRLVAVSSTMDTLDILEVATGKQRFRLAGNDSRITALGMTGDGKTLVPGTEEGRVRLWDLESGQVRSTVQLEKAPGLVCVSASGLRILAGNEQGIEVLECDTGRQWRIAESSAGLAGLALLTADGSRVVVGSHERRITVWDVDSRTAHFSWCAHSGPITSIAVSRDGSRLVSSSEDRTVKSWDLTREGAYAAGALAAGAIWWLPVRRTQLSGPSINGQFRR